MIGIPLGGELGEDYLEEVMKAEGFHPSRVEMCRNCKYPETFRLNRGFGLIEFETFEEALRCLAEFKGLSHTHLEDDSTLSTTLQVRPLCQLLLPDVIGSGSSVDIEKCIREQQEGRGKEKESDSKEERNNESGSSGEDKEKEG